MRGVKILAVNGPVPPLGPNAKILADEVDSWPDDALSLEDLYLIRHALGLDYAKHPYKNFTAWNTGRPTYPKAMRLVNLGLFAEDRAADFGKMRVFRVTQAGFNAVGIVRPKKGLLDLVPKVIAPLPLAA